MPQRRLRILSLATVFPNPGEPNLGLFVRARLAALSEAAEVTVLAPVPMVDYYRIRLGLPRTRPPFHRQDGRLKVLHPCWLYPPAFGSGNGLLLALRLLPLVARLMRSEPADVLDAHFGHPEGIAAAFLSRALKVPFTVTLRGNETMHASYFLRRRLMRFALRRAAAVITVSESLRRFAIEMGAEPGRVFCVPNGVDTGRFFPRDRDLSRQRLGLSEGGKMILSVGYLIERKGHHHVIRALRELRDAGCEASLWIAGGPGREGHFEERLRQLTAELRLQPFVHFTGALPPNELPALMSAADVLCLASSREGWPNVVQEALACGTPVVTTDVGGAPQMIPSPDYGSVVPAGDSAALAAALREALERNWDRRKISAWGQSRSWNAVACETLTVLEKAARNDFQNPSKSDIKE